MELLPEFEAKMATLLRDTCVYEGSNRLNWHWIERNRLLLSLTPPSLSVEIFEENLREYRGSDNPYFFQLVAFAEFLPEALRADALEKLLMATPIAADLQGLAAILALFERDDWERYRPAVLATLLPESERQEALRVVWEKLKSITSQPRYCIEVVALMGWPATETTELVDLLVERNEYYALSQILDHMSDEDREFFTAVFAKD
jgi:hypothetical protein